MNCIQEKNLDIGNNWCERMSLRLCFLKIISMCSPHQRTRSQSKRYSETSFCTCEKGSLTIEAAIVVPLAMGFLVIFLFFFRVIQVQAEVEEALIYVGQSIAVEGCILESEGELYALAQTLLISCLEQSETVEDYIEGGSLGILLFGSDMDADEVILRAHYEIRIPIAFFDVKSIPMYSQNRFMKWNGEITDYENQEWVYITPTGTVYHATPLCRTLDLSIKDALLSEISGIRGSNGQKYYPCSRCFIEGERIVIAYYTDYGTLYHARLSCSALKRTVIKIARSKVQERRGCSYCYP